MRRPWEDIVLFGRGGFFPGAAIDMNFAAGRYRGATPSSLTVSRATPALTYGQTSSGTLTGFAANTPRITNLGLLVEESRINVLPGSQALSDNTYWSYSNVSVTGDTTTAPDGTTTADSVAANTTAAPHFFYAGTVNLTSATTYSLSAYVKKSTASYVILNIQASANNYITAVFNLDAGTVGETSAGSSSGTIVSTSITSLANGWYRISITGSVTGSSSPVLAFAPAASGNVFTTVGLVSFASTTDTIFYAWGVQAEAGTFPTSYIPTTTTNVTRAADVLSMSLSPWFNSNEGTFYTEAVIDRVATAFAFILDVSHGTDNDHHDIYVESDNSRRARTLVGGAIQAQFQPAGSPAAGEVRRQAYAYKVNDFAHSANGGTVGTDTSGSLPTVTTAYIGVRWSGGQLNGYLKRFAYWPRRITNSELQSVTA